MDLFFIVLFMIIIIISISITKCISQWIYNNKQPIIICNCKIVGKRMSISNYNWNNNKILNYTNNISYYITFEFENNKRKEFNVTAKQYGILSENDYGKLKFKGYRFLYFERYV